MRRRDAQPIGAGFWPAVREAVRLALGNLRRRCREREEVPDSVDGDWIIERLKARMLEQDLNR